MSRRSKFTKKHKQYGVKNPQALCHTSVAHQFNTPVSHLAYNRHVLCVRVYVHEYYLHPKHCCLFVAVAYTLMRKSVKGTHTRSLRKRHALLNVRNQDSTQRAKRYCRFSRGSADRISDRCDVTYVSITGSSPWLGETRLPVSAVNAGFLPFAGGTGCTPMYE